MYHSAKYRLAAIALAMFTLALPLLADNVTISGTTTFAALDGSSLDHDGVSNGTFTVDDGNLTVLGTINCNDDGPGANSACAMQFVVSGNVVLAPGSAIYAENRTKSGNGGNITFNVGGNVLLQGTSGVTPGAIISSAKTNDGNPAHGGDITIVAGGAFTQGAGSIVSSGAKDSNAGAIAITSAGATVGGYILAGPTRAIASTIYTGAVFSGGGGHSVGGPITIKALTHSEPGLTVTSTAIIASQGTDQGGNPITLEGCGVQINGLIASLAKKNAGPAVIIRSGTSLTIDSSTLAGVDGAHRGAIRASAIKENATGYHVDLYARNSITVIGPSPSSTFWSVQSNGGDSGNDISGTVNVISTTDAVTASGNAFQATGSKSDDRGGNINVSAKNNVTLNGATLDAAGGPGGGHREGGDIAVRSYSGAVNWQAGVGDVRPVGSSAGIPVALQGTISLTYCTTLSTSGTSFPTNGSPVGTFPTTAQTCSPAAPSLPVGNMLPDCNDPPIAANDAYSVAEGGTLTVSAPGVLTNDVDPDGDPITAVLVSGPSNASSFTLNANGSFSYTHNGGETTSDSFTYQATDGVSFSNTATVTITITPVNDPPVANNDNYSVAEGGTINLAVPGVLANDTDPDGPTMSAILVSGPAHASSFTLNPNGSFQYVHDGSETLTDSFTYQVSDGSLLSNVATVSITITPVNDAPVAVNDAYAVNEGGTLNGSSVLANDTDAENNSLTAVLVSGPAHASSFTLNANGTFTYVHDGSETPASDSFTYKANDGLADSNVATVTITITPVNDAPVAVPDAYSVDEGGTLNGSSVLANDTDAENNPLTAVLVSGPANASSFVLNADGTFTYVHNGSETTSDSFTYKANDGSLDSNTTTVTITINPVNEAPTAVNDAYSVNEGGTLNGSSVLTNDTDPENDTLNAVLVSGPANASSFTLNPDGTFTYVHNGSETTSDSFTYKANDGALDSNVATVTITITAVNDAPVAVPDAYSVNEGGTLNGTSVLTNDTDAENNPLTAVLVSGPSNAASFTLNPDGTFTYVHNGSETTSDSFTYKANDGSLDSNTTTVTITITPVNDAPVANPDAYNVNFHGSLTVIAPGVLGNDTDADGPGLTAILVSTTTQGNLTFNADGSFSYTHTGASPGTDSFTYKANDGSLDSNVTTVTITIANQTPVAGNDAFLGVGNTELRVGTGAAAHPAAVVSGSVLANDTDPDGGPSPLTVTAFDAVSGAGGTVTMNPNGTFNFLPATGFTGVDSFTYTISDGLDTDTGTVTVTLVERVWYVNPTAAGPQTGRSTDPFATIGQAQGASAINDYIHVAQGVQATGILLKNGQRLIGSGVALVVGPYTLTGATIRPSLGSAVILASNNLVTGLNVGGIGAGVTGSSVTAGTITEVGVTSGGDGISLTNSGGTFTITNVTLTPGARGLAITGGGVTIAATNLDVTTTGSTGIVGNAGTLNVGAGVDGSTVNTTNGIGISLSNMTVGAAFRSVNASGAANGINLTNTSGGFTVTGSGVAGSGGTIQNTTGRGANFQHNGSVSLSFMNFTNTSSTNGSAASVCGDTFTGTNLGCNAAIHLQGVTLASLSNVNVNGSAQIGINGNSVSNLTMSNVTVTGAGNETFEHGVQFVNLSGTGSITNSTFSNNFYRQFTAQNSSGTLTLSVTGSTFSSTGAATGAQGVLISGHGTANITTNVQSSIFTNNFGAGYFSDGADSAVLNVTVANGTFTNNGGGGVNVSTNNTAPLTYSITGNTLTGTQNSAIVVFKAATSNTSMSGTVSGNTIGLAGVPNSGTPAFSVAILLDGQGSGTYTAAADNNIVRNFGTFGIWHSASDSLTSNVAIRNNTISEPSAGATAGVFAQSGTLSTNTTSVCADIQGNLISGATYAGGQIRVRNRFATTTFRLPGFAGPFNSTAAVMTFLSGQNNAATVTATISGNTFQGGAACVAP
jgi:VCBS repeat-containing protein